MSNNESIIQRFQEMPRAIQWASYAALFIICFLIWDETIQPVTSSWNRQAASIREDLAAVQHADVLLNNMARSEDLIRAFGEVRIPDVNKSGADLGRAINDLLKEHRLSNDSFTLGAPRPLPRDTLSQIATGDRRAKFINGELRFESSLQTAATVIRQLESHPDIEAVSSVLLRRVDRHKVEVQITVESWVISQA